MTEPTITLTRTENDPDDIADGEPRYAPGDYKVYVDGRYLGRVVRNDTVSRGYYGRWRYMGRTGSVRHYGHTDTRRSAALALWHLAGRAQEATR